MVESRTEEKDLERYWLSQCHGFRVHYGRRRIGIVEDVLLARGNGRPSALAVRGGLFGQRVALIPTEIVVEVTPRLKRVVVRGSEDEA